MLSTEITVEQNAGSLELKFPHGEHDACEELTEFTYEHLPRDSTLGRPLNFKRGADIWQPDDRTDRVYFLEQGQVSIVSVDREGHETVLVNVDAGEIFGELCFCGSKEKVRRTTARAAAKSRVFEIKVEDFTGFLQKDQSLLQKMIFTFCLRLARAERRIETLAMRGVEERLGSVLLHLAETRGVVTNAATPDVVTLTATHEELAALAATSRQRVSTTMSDFRGRELLNYNRKQPITINTRVLSDYLYENAA